MPTAAKASPAVDRVPTSPAASDADEHDPVFLHIRDGVETLVRASELPGAGSGEETNGQRLIRALAKLPKPSCVEERDTELIPEREGL